MIPHPSISPVHPKRAEAVTFAQDEWRAVVNGQLQRPMFNARGPALIFAQQVCAGLRKPEPVNKE